MKAYNLDFLIAGLLLLLIILYHYKRQKKPDSADSRFFRFFIGLGIADVLFDFATSVLIMRRIEGMTEVTRFLLTVFYLLQVLVPYAVVYYAQSLREVPVKRLRRDMAVWTVIPVLMGGLVVVNHWAGFLFYFDGSGAYRPGPGYLLMYEYAILYAAAAALVSILYFRELGLKKAVVIWQFLLLEGIFSGIQAVNRSCLLTGFGLSLGILVLYLTISNPNSYTDQMTGVFGKQYFGKWFQEQIARGSHVHVISISIRNLRQINKIFGNSAGDRLLIEITKELRQISGTAEVFRMSGKQFFLVMRSLSDYEKCREYAGKLFGNSFEIDGEQIRVFAMLCGVINAEALQEDALLAYIDYMETLTSGSEDTVMIQSDKKIMDGFLYVQEVERFLHTAIEKDLFEVNFQPVYSIAAGDYRALEALSRLRHPTLGYVPPDVFITLAERNGQISQIGQLQFRRVCRFIREHREIMERIENVKFNLSPLELLKYGYAENLIGIIREYDLPPSYFQFEITETVATEYSENLYRAADLFLAAGIGLCLDDFGSGFANINTVLKLPFSCIKIDRSLLKGIGEEEQIAVFYHSVIGALQNMGYKIISEGVETKEEKELLESWGVDMIQGYYFSKPLGEKGLVKLLEDTRRAEYWSEDEELAGPCEFL